MRLVLYQPDIPPNAGTLIRMGACLGLGIDIIEPCGFAASDKDLKRAAMDYADHADIVRHTTWERFLAQLPARARVVLLSSRGETVYTEFRYDSGDYLVVGRESGGADAQVWDRAAVSVRIPLMPGMRSLNVAMAAAMVTGEALRQTAGFPAETLYC